MSSDSRIAVVIPAYNEESAIASVIDTIPEFINKIIVIDDASSDQTSGILAKIVNSRLVVITHKNKGVGAAIVSGYKKALELNIDVVAVVGGDGQMDPNEMKSLVEPIISGEADYVKGNRFLSGIAHKEMPKLRWVGNVILSCLTKPVSGYWKLFDSQCGYTAISAKILKVLPLDQIYPRYGVPNDILVRLNMLGAEVVEKPVTPIYNGRSHMRLATVSFSISLLLVRLYLLRISSGANQDAFSRVLDEKTNCLILTSSIPRFKGDYAGCFIDELAEKLEKQYKIQILAPDDKSVDSEFDKQKNIERFGKFSGFSSPFYGNGAPYNLRKFGTKFITPIAVSEFLAKAFRLSKNADIIDAHWLVPAGICAAMIKRKHQQFRVFVHGSDWQLLKKSHFGRSLARFIMHRADQVFVVAKYQKEEILEIFGRDKLEIERKIRVFPMMINTPNYACKRQKTANKAHKVLIGGRLVTNKNFHLALHALAGFDVKLTIFGDGEKRNELLKLAEKLKLDFEYLGVIKTHKMPELLQNSDLVIIPSNTSEKNQEGTPRFLLEAMASGCAIIATSSGGIADIIKDNENGLLCETSISSIKEKLELLLADPNLQSKLQTNAIKHAKNYDWDRVFEEACFIFE